MGLEGLVILIVFSLVIIAAIIMIVVGIRSSDDVDPIETRLIDVVETGRTDFSLEEIELEQSISERVFIPLARSLGNFALRFTPQNFIKNTARNLDHAGNPRGIDPTVFWALRFMGIGLGLFVFLVTRIAPPESFVRRGITAYVLAIFFGVIGFFVPELWLRSKIQRRQKEIRRAMPDALDLLTICVEAGLGFDMAMKRVYEKWDNELSLLFGRVLREMQLGKIRREALRDMADRVGISEMSSFIAAIIQSEQLGVSLANVLQIQSEVMRVRRRQLAEEEAQKAPIKMLFPMAFLIFPSLLIILLGPAVIILLQSALGEMMGFR